MIINRRSIAGARLNHHLAVLHAPSAAPASHTCPAATLTLPALGERAPENLVPVGSMLALPLDVARSLGVSR